MVLGGLWGLKTDFSQQQESHGLVMELNQVHTWQMPLQPTFPCTMNPGIRIHDTIPSKLCENKKNVIFVQVVHQKRHCLKNIVFPEMTKMLHTYGLYTYVFFECNIT